MSTWMDFGSILGTFWCNFWTLWAPVTNFSARSAALEKQQTKGPEKSCENSRAKGVPLKQLEAGG